MKNAKNRPIDELVGIMIKEAEWRVKLETLLINIYRNAPHPTAAVLIEALADEKRGSDFHTGIEIVKSERG